MLLCIHDSAFYYFLVKVKSYITVANCTFVACGKLVYLIANFYKYFFDSFIELKLTDYIFKSSFGKVSLSPFPYWL